MLNAKFLSNAVVGLCFVTMLAGVGFAQRGGFGGRGQQTRARYELATLPEVQAELKLTDEQKKLAADLLAKQREKRQSFGQGGDFQAMRAEMAKMNAEFDTEFTGKLDETQKARMHGLIAQVNGAAALLDAAISKALQINDEQANKLKAVNEANMAARREAMSGLQDSTPEQRQEAMTKLADKENKSLLAEITDDQKKKFEDLKGAALTIDQSPLRPTRRGQ